ncbi:MAG: nucleoside transporter C-terminal domain-containing protein [Candidatus Hydrogenedentota bacterium]
MHNLISLFGLVVIIFLAWLISYDRRTIPWRVIIWGVILQLFFAFIVLYWSPGRRVFEILNDAIVKVLDFTVEGSVFVFNALGVPPGQTRSGTQSLGFFFAFQVLTTIIFFSSLMSVLYYLGIMQKIVLFFAKIMAYTMGTSGAESLSASANIFVGQTEAPLVVKPYVEKMTDSELLCIMSGGFATVAGGVMGAYVMMLKDYFPNIAGHLLSASVLSAPAALVMAKIILPEKEEPLTKGEVKLQLKITDVNIIDAAANGASTGLTLALNVASMLIAFVALIAMLNFGVNKIGNFFGYENLTIQLILGWIHWPIAWVLGIPTADCFEIGKLLGEKLILTEFIAYLDLAKVLVDPDITLDPRSIVIATYSLCGFANFASIAIQIGGIGGIAPSRRSDLARLGLRGMWAGCLAAYMTGNIAGIFYTGETILKATQ